MIGLILATFFHIAICLGSFTLACLIDSGFHFGTEAIRLWQNCVPLVLLVRATSFVGFDEWLRRHRHSIWNDILSILATVTFGSAILGSAHWAGLLDNGPKGNVYALDWLLTVMGMGLMRATIRIEASHLSRRSMHRGKRRTIVYGTDQRAVALVNAANLTKPDFEIVALVEPSGQPKYTILSDVPVAPLKRAITSIARRFDASCLAIPDTLPGPQVRRFAHDCQKARLALKVYSDIEFGDSNKSIPKLRELTLADLYRATPTQPAGWMPANEMTEKSILISGAAGRIGAECCRQMLKLRPKQLILVDQSEFGIRRIERELSLRAVDDTDLITVVADVNDQVTLGRAFADYLPDLVLHAAAYCDAELMERNVCTAIRNNVLGTQSIVDLADRFGIERFVMVSSQADSQVTDIIAATDRMRERYIAEIASSSKTHFVTVQIGKVLDSAGSITNSFRQQIAAGGPILVDSPESSIAAMTIPDAVNKILEFSESVKSGQTVTLDHGEPISLTSLAKSLISLSKYRFPDEIDVVFSGVRSSEPVMTKPQAIVAKSSPVVGLAIDSTAPELAGARQIKLQLQQLEKASHGSSSDAREAIRAIVPDYSFDRGGEVAHRKASLSKALALKVA